MKKTRADGEQWRRRLVDGLELDVKDERAVGRNVADALVAVAHVWRNGDGALAAHFHVLEADVPALDDLAGAQTESERLAGRARVELLAVLLELAGVVDVDLFALLGDRSVALLGVFDGHTTSDGLDLAGVARLQVLGLGLLKKGTKN